MERKCQIFGFDWFNRFDVYWRQTNKQEKYCNKCLTPIFLYKCVSIHTQSYQKLSPPPNPGRSKCISIHTQSYQTLSSLPNPGRSKCISIHTQSYQTLSSLLSPVIKHYPHYWTVVGLVFIDTHSNQTLHSLPSNGSSNRP